MFTTPPNLATLSQRAILTWASLLFTTGISLAEDRVDPKIGSGDQPKRIFVLLDKQLFNQAGEFETFAEAQNQHKRSTLRFHAISTLKNNANESWSKLKSQLAGLPMEVKDRFWVVNGFTAVASPRTCRQIASLDGVKYVYQYGGSATRRTPITAAQKSAMERAGKLRQQSLPIPVDAPKLKWGWNLEKLNVPEVWRKHQVYGHGVCVAVNDGGVAIAPELSHQLWQNEDETLNGRDDDQNGLIDDVHGYDFSAGSGFVHSPNAHGTACAGIILGQPSEQANAITGIAPQTRLMPLIGGLHLRLYEYALENNVDILSLSFMSRSDKQGAWRGVVRLLHEHVTVAGMLCVGGAGNFGPGSRRAWPKGLQIGAPKDIPCVIAVAGIYKNDTLAPMSSRGPCFWKNLPFYSDHGDDAPLSKPDLTACFGGYPVWFVVNPDAPNSRIQIRARRGDVSVGQQRGSLVLATGPQGNSFSGPHAAGVAALILSANPELHPWQVKSILQSTAKDLGDQGWDPGFGHGLIDAEAAVAMAKSIDKS